MATDDFRVRAAALVQRIEQSFRSLDECAAHPSLPPVPLHAPRKSPAHHVNSLHNIDISLAQALAYTRARLLLNLPDDVTAIREVLAMRGIPLPKIVLKEWGDQARMRGRVSRSWGTKQLGMVKHLMATLSADEVSIDTRIKLIGFLARSQWSPEG